jgi:hypothetical protein
MRAWLIGRWPVIAALIFIQAIAIYNTAPGLHDEIWQDEAFTLLKYASGSFWTPFKLYINPNNHVLFSALLSLWQSGVPDPFDTASLRLLPFVFFMLSVPATYLAGQRLNGTACGLIAALMFAASTITANHATQLRAYSTSWLPFALMLWTSLNINGEKPVRNRVAYVASAMFAVALLPSNLFLGWLLAIAVTAYHLAQRDSRTRRHAIGYAILFLGPLSGLIAYAAIWRNVLEAANMDWSGWNRDLLFGQWAISSLAEFPALALLMLMGLALCLLRARGTRRWPRSRPRHRAIWARLACGYRRACPRVAHATVSAHVRSPATGLVCRYGGPHRRVR